MNRSGWLLVALAVSAHAVAFDAGRAGFSVLINEEVIPYEEFAVYVLPDEDVEVKILAEEPDATVRFDAATPRKHGVARWRFTAPSATGIYRLHVSNGDAQMRVNVFVMVPAKQVEDGYLNGFRIGEYPARPLRGDPVYLPPRGYIELTKSNGATRVSPNFTLGQFPAKQAGGYPKYLVLREALLLKLELLLEEVNNRGFPTDSFVVMSGYRTPYYNASIGNVPSSRHVYGGAADIFVDTSPEDGVMDDLNGDGKLDFRDAQRLYLWANALFAREENRRLVGGLGVYRRNPAHGPFLHVDARGHRARWGMLP